MPFGFVVAAGLSAGLVSAGLVSAGFVSNPFGSVPFGFVVAAGLSAGLVSAGLVSAGFASAGFGVGVSSCVDNLFSLDSNSAILSSRSFFVCLAAAIKLVEYTGFIYIWVYF